MTVDEIRQLFLKFFKERSHKIYPSDSLVPANDPTLLFTSAGMNQFKDEFLGRVKGPRRAVTCQKCLRTGDLENVGKTPDHHTFFEMLGNFSFGDYFKKDAIIWAWEFLTKELGLKEKDLWVSVYKDDDEAYDIWRKIVKVPIKKIMKLGAKDNFWPSDAPTKGPNGPCGPCSEIFYGSRDGVEVWNLVFTQFDRQEDGKLDDLPNKNIDTGMGLERIARVMQGKKTNFDIDSFQPVINAIKDLAEYKKPSIAPHINAIADHIRAVTFAIGDGVFPSNEERGYVIRKLIRKAFWYGRSFGLEKPFLYKLVPLVAKVMKSPYPELTKEREDIAQVVLTEETRFMNTIQEGLEKLTQMIEKCPSKGTLSGEAVFKLYDTYGFPLEMTQEIADGEGMKVDIKGFQSSMEKQRLASRGKSSIKGSIFVGGEDIKLELPPETSFMEGKNEVKTSVLQIIVGNKIKKSVNKDERASLFLKETPFYGEKGGQVGDIGVLIKDGKELAEVLNAIDVAGRVRHDIKVKNSSLNVGDTVTAKIDPSYREAIRKNHTATHLLHNALRKVLGQHVKQAGSLVAPDRLRFDFTHFKALSGEEIARVEDIVNEYIKENSRVDIKNMGFDDAKKSGAIALFGEKYGDLVRMVSVGSYSKELCGGTHVNKTGEIQIFKIISESSIASGVRRIEAVTADMACREIKQKVDSLKEISNELNTSPEEVLQKIKDLTDKIRELEKGFNATSDRLVNSISDDLLNNVKDINGKETVISEVKNVDAALLRKVSDLIKRRFKKGIFMLLSEYEGKIFMVVGICGDKNISAVKMLNDIGKDFNIKGGGRPDFAQAGGRSGIESKKILEKAKEIIGAL